MKTDQPNIAVLLLDAARARNFSCYCYERETTPFIDQLARTGTRYKYAFSNSIYSLPSYASLFTGQYPTEHGALNWDDRIDQNILVEGMNEAGYETRAVSTHLISNEFGIGDAFDRIESLFLESKDVIFEDDPVSEQMRKHDQKNGWSSEREKYTFFMKQFLRTPSYKSVVNGGYKFYRKLRKYLGWWDDDGGCEAVETAKDVVSTADNPFFLFMNFIETHDPYRPPRNYFRDFLPDDASLSEVKSALDYVSTRATAGLQEITPRQRELLLALYDAEIKYADDLIREFVEFLEAEGLREDTVIVVLSDHGDAFGEHGLWGHQGRVYNELCHVPLVINYPWRDDDVVTETTELRELPGHLLALADGGTERMPARGEALIEYYGWDTQLSFAPWEKYGDISVEQWGQYQAALIEDRLKLISDAAGNRELYNIEADYSEVSNMVNDIEDAVARLEKRVVDLVGEPKENHAQYRRRITKDNLDQPDELTDHLRDLGYVE